MAPSAAPRTDPGPGHAGVPGTLVRLLRRDVPLVLLDVGVVVVAYLAPLVLRFEGAIPDRYWVGFWPFAAVAALAHLGVNHLFGLYGEMWRYASVHEARRLVVSCFTAGGFLVAADVVLPRRPLPVSVVTLGAMLSLMGFGAIRFQSRLFAFRRRSTAPGRRRLLVVGAGSGASMVLKDVLRNPALGLEPVAIVDDDPRKQGLSLHEVPVRGTSADIPALVRELRVDEVLLAIPSATSDLVRGVAARCEEAGVPLRILPSVRETVGGRVQARDIRDLRIEDLLGRRQVETDLAAVAALLRGRRVLVTGAGGSIGSEIARQVAAFEPAALVLLDRDETHLHDVQTELERSVPLEAVLADIRDQGRLLTLFDVYRPQVVFHAAAHKHLPVLERYPEEALANNVLGTANVADAALATGVERFVLVSTDKAVRPTSVMGASKWFAEQIVRSLQGSGCTFCAVRFGNVLGSRGSVIPTFLAQIARGGPVTVTDPGMARYFMTVQEAVQLVLQASALARGGEVFTLEMGDPVRILDLARNLIRLAGRVPGRDVDIVVVGPRPGEKLVEDLVDPDEEPLPSAHPAIVVSRPPTPDPAALRRALRDLEALAAAGLTAELGERMKELARTRLRLVELEERV